MGRFEIRNWPPSSDFTLRVMPVAVLVAVTDALGTTDPDGSVTVPTMVASCANAHRDNAKNSVLKTAIRWNRWSLQACRMVLAHFEAKFIRASGTSFSTVNTP